MTVAAVTPALVAGLRCQTSPPTETFTGPDGLARAHASGATWIWLVMDGGEPRPDALERLMAARASCDEVPAILAGMAVGRDGAILEHRLPGWRIQAPGLVELVAHHLLPVRHTSFANCLVAAGCFARHGLPRTARYGPYAAEEWSARVLRDEPGYFVPASVVELDAAGARAAGGRSVPALARMLTSGAWSRRDAVGHVGDLLGRFPQGPSA